MEITIKSRNRKVKRSIETDHYWYDPMSKKMFHGRGGKMEFVYDPIQKRSLPRVVDAEDWLDGNDYPEIKKWIEKNQSTFNISVLHDGGKNITISIPVTNLNDVLGSLYISALSSDYDEAELKKELRRR